MLAEPIHVPGVPLYEEVEEHEFVPATMEHSKPRYPSTAIGGESWESFFSRLAAKKPVPDSVPDDPDEPDELEVIERGYDLADPCAAPGAPGTIAKRLRDQGWAVRVHTARAHAPAVLYKSASDEGSEKSYQVGDVLFNEHFREVWIVIAVKRAGGQMMALEATWLKKTKILARLSPPRPGGHETPWIAPGGFAFQNATTHDPILGREWRTTSLKPRKPRGMEIEDEIDGPMGFTEWLALVAPKPEPKKKVKEA